MTDEEILKIANKDGFPAQFKQYREFLRLKLSALQFLEVERESIDKNKDPKGFKYCLDLADEINEIIKEEEQKFMAKNGNILKQLMAWAEANPK